MELEKGDFFEGSTEVLKVLRCLGQGKCSKVYEVHDQLGGTVAVKVYKKEKEYVNAGLNELQILQMLHKDDGIQDRKERIVIVKILDVFYCQDHLCLVMPSLSHSINHIMTVHGWHGDGLSLYFVQKCCRELANALVYLKKHGIVHADIKPSNVMWCAEQELFQLVDFGMSFQEDYQPCQPVQSQSYCSPEAQLWNRNIFSSNKKVEPCTCACDVWSFACLLFVLFYGYHFFNPQETMLSCCENCQNGVVCTYELNMIQRVKAAMPSSWLQQKNVTETQHGIFVDLLTKMLKCKPGDRIQPEKIICHPFLSSENTVKFPSLTDLMVLPTKILQLTNMFDKQDGPSDADEQQEYMDDIQQECRKFGAVKSIRIPFLDSPNNSRLVGKVFVEFTRSSDCEGAHQQLTGRTFNNRTVITSYFPSEDFQLGKFY